MYNTPVKFTRVYILLVVRPYRLCFVHTTVLNHDAIKLRDTKQAAAQGIEVRFHCESY